MDGLDAKILHPGAEVKRLVAAHLGVEDSLGGGDRPGLDGSRAQRGPSPHELLRGGVVGDCPAGGVHGHGLHEGAVGTEHDVGKQQDMSLVWIYCLNSQIHMVFLDNFIEYLHRFKQF